MKYSKLTIAGVPKSFVIWDVVDYVQDLSEDESPDDVQYDFYSAECNEEKGEDACVLFKYDESATGIFGCKSTLFHPIRQTFFNLFLGLNCLYKTCIKKDSYSSSNRS